MADAAEAPPPLRLDRRADWRSTGASPFGFGLRGQLPGEQEPVFWRYDDLGFPVWIHRDNEKRPERPLVFVVDLPAGRGGQELRPSERLLVIRV